MMPTPIKSPITKCAYRLKRAPTPPLCPPPGFHPNLAPAFHPHPVPLAIANNDAILQQLVNSISHQNNEAATANDLMTSQLKYNIEKYDKKKDPIKKLYHSIKQLILFASAEDAESQPIQFMQKVHEFWNRWNSEPRTKHAIEKIAS